MIAVALPPGHVLKRTRRGVFFEGSGTVLGVHAIEDSSKSPDLRTQSLRFFFCVFLSIIFTLYITTDTIDQRTKVVKAAAKGVPTAETPILLTVSILTLVPEAHPVPTNAATKT